MQYVVEIREENLEQFEVRVAKLNKTCVKLNLPMITFNVLSSKFRKTNHFDAQEKWLTIEMTTPEFIGIPEWNILGVVRLLPNGAVVFGSESINDEYRRYTLGHNICAHCGSNRQRNKLVILEKDGQQLAIGSSCVNDFTGHNALQAAMFFEDMIIDGEEFDEDREPINKWYATSLILQLAIQSIQAIGYISREYASANNMLSTADEVLYALFKGKTERSESVIKLSEKILEWVLSTTENSQYMRNLRMYAGNECVTLRDVGYVSSMVVAYLKAKEAAEAPQKLNEWFGTVGAKKVELKLVCKVVRVIDTQFGVSTLTILEDSEGRSFKHFGRALFEQGETYELTATIKGHETYNNCKQTVISFVKIK